MRPNKPLVLTDAAWFSAILLIRWAKCSRLLPMSTAAMEPNQIEAAALNLDARSRASLAEKLLRSLDNLSEDEADALWAEEAERRDAEMDLGANSGRPAEEVLRDIRARRR